MTVDNHSGKESSFGEELIQCFAQVLSHHRGAIELEQVWPKTMNEAKPELIRTDFYSAQVEFGESRNPLKPRFGSIGWVLVGLEPLLWRHTRVVCGIRSVRFFKAPKLADDFLHLCILP